MKLKPAIVSILLIVGTTVMGIALIVWVSKSVHRDRIEREAVDRKISYMEGRRDGQRQVISMAVDAGVARYECDARTGKVTCIIGNEAWFSIPAGNFEFEIEKATKPEKSEKPEKASTE